MRLGWAGLVWLCPIGLGSIALDAIGLGWRGWIGLDWVGLGWIGLLGLDWTELGWVGLGWIGGELRVHLGVRVVQDVLVVWIGRNGDAERVT